MGADRAQATVRDGIKRGNRIMMLASKGERIDDAAG
jgi:hypothetical protein